MRRSERIESAARAVVNATPRHRAAAIAALRAELETPIASGHQRELNWHDVEARYTKGESQAAIAADLDVTRNAIYRIIKAARLAGRIA